jgi:hypothetical protein
MQRWGMMEAAMKNEGTLSVHIDSESIFFGDNVPVEVRDGELRLIRGPSHERTFTLPFGLYEVSAVLEDGRRHKDLVQIKDEGVTRAKLGPVEVVRATTNPATTKGYSSFERTCYTQKLEHLTDDAGASPSELNVQLLEVNGASLYKEGRQYWIFECTQSLDQVANALFRVGSAKVCISLPVSSDRQFPNNSCVVKVDETASGPVLNAWISKERTVANALQNMLCTGYTFNAADMAADAVDLLCNKYSDPTGAALGALILCKAGRLESWQGWMENLARDFDWLPDGKVLLSKLLYDQRTDMDRACQLAVQASAQKMLYSENYSTLLDLLRRWPKSFDNPARQQAVENMASQASYINWESLCLYQTVPENE